MSDDKRMEILKRLEKGEINAARAEEFLDALDAAPEPGAAGPGPEAFTNVTQWSPRDAVTEVKIDNFAGDIVARAGAETRVVAKVRAGGAEADARQAFKKVDFSFEEKDGVAHVKARLPKNIFDLLRGARVAVDFEVTMPATAKLAASYGAGDVTSQGIAALEANFGNGRVETDAPLVDVNAGNARVASRGGREVAVNGGNVRIALEDADALRVFRFNTGNGEVKLAQKRLPTDAAYDMNFGSGKVEATFERRPADCVITISSLAGKLDTDIPFNKEGARMIYAAGEPKARVHIHAGSSKVAVRVKEEK